MEELIYVLGRYGEFVGIFGTEKHKGRAMKAIQGGDSKGMLGEFEYTHVFRRGLGHQIIWERPPPSGTEVRNRGGDKMEVDEIGLAGMVACTRKSDGVQLMVFPWDLVK